MRDYQNSYSNNHFTVFDKKFASWANNHNGWSKAKKNWRRIGKHRLKEQDRKLFKKELE